MRKNEKQSSFKFSYYKKPKHFHNPKLSFSLFIQSDISKEGIRIVPRKNRRPVNSSIAKVHSEHFFFGFLRPSYAYIDSIRSEKKKYTCTHDLNGVFLSGESNRPIHPVHLTRQQRAQLYKHSKLAQLNNLPIL